MAKKQTKRKSKKPTKALKKQNNLWLPALIVGMLGFAIYLNTLSHGYTLDDFSAIKDNYVTQSGIEGISTIFETHYRYGYWNSPGELYRPFTLAMFAVEWEFFPDSPFIGHLGNVLFYAITGVLFFLFLAKIFKGYNLLLPFFAAMIFIAHPVHVEVVANIKSRDEIMAFLGSLAALYWLMKYWETEKIQCLAFSVLSYFVAMFSKENAITFLAIFPLVGYFFSKQKLNKVLRSSAVLIIPVVIYLLVRQNVIGDMVTAKSAPLLDNVLVAADSGLEKFATAILFLGKYLKTLFLPHPLGSDFGYNQIPVTSFTDWKVLLSLVIHAGLLIFAFKRFVKKDLLSFAILFYFITFSIFSNIFITIGSSYGDRFLYAASGGFAIALVLLIAKILKTSESDSGKQLFPLFSKYPKFTALASIIVLLFCLKTMSRNTAWVDSFTLYETDIKTAPNSAKLNYHYGLELAKKGDDAEGTEKTNYYTKAKQHLNKALEIFPQYHDAYGRLGLTYYYETNPTEAMKNYELSVKYKPNNSTVYSNMGTLYFEQQNIPKAMESYQKAVEIDPRFVDGWRNLGSLNAMTQNFQEAIRCFQEGLKFAPEDATLNYYLGSAYTDSGNAAAGKPYLEKAYLLNPSLKKK